MTTPREDLAAQLAADNPDWTVLAYQFQPANVSPGKPIVTVWRGELAPGDSALTLNHKLTVFAFGSRTAGAEAEAEMDDILDGVLLSLERLSGWKFESARRGVFYEGTLSGWHIEASALSKNVYREVVMTEERGTANG